MAVTGKPAISDVKGDRALGVAISNIRQRIEAIEGEVGTVSSTVTQSSTTGSTQFNTLRQMILALQQELTALELLVAGLAADGDQTQIAVRAFMPHTPATPTKSIDDHENQIANRAFMPHVPLTQAQPASDADAQLATQAFARRPPALPDLALAGDNATRVLITQVFGA